MHNKSQYVLSVFRQVYSTYDLNPAIQYGYQGSSKIIIIPGNVERLKAGEPIPADPDAILWKTWKGASIPFFFNAVDTDFYSRKGDQWIIHVDIISAAFFLLSGWHEYHLLSRDKKSTITYKESIQYAFDIMHLPVVNYYFDILRTVIEEAYQTTLTPHHWEGHPFSVFLSHDIDTCASAWLEGGYNSLKNGDILTPFTLIGKKLFSHDAWFNFDDILALERYYHATSTFFFLARKGKKMNKKNADYTVSRRKFKRVFDRITQEGSEVGIHGSIGTHHDGKSLREEIETVNFPVCGNRFHFLLYDPVTTPVMLEESSLAYDASLGFPEMPGFRSSFCFPYHPYCLATDKPLSYVEIPLTVMDGTLQKHLGLNPQEGFLLVERLINEVRKFGGCLSILWHNTHVSDVKYAEWKPVYLQILEACASRNAKLSNGVSLLASYFGNEIAQLNDCFTSDHHGKK